MIDERACPFFPADPFGLCGAGLNKEPLPADEIDSWFATMRTTLDARWSKVEETVAGKRLTAELSRRVGRSVSATEAREWYQDSRQDHRWRIRLLNPETALGRLHRAWVEVWFDYGDCFGDEAIDQALRKRLAFLLDLEEDGVGWAFGVPHLRTATFVSDGHFRMSSRRLVMDYLEGIRIPRRYSQARARRAIAALFRERPRAYWRAIQQQSRREVEAALEPYGRIKEEGLLGEALGKGAELYTAGVLDPALDLSVGVPLRDGSLDPKQVARARRRYQALYPRVRRHMRLRRVAANASSLDPVFESRIASALRFATGPRAVALQLVVEDLELAVGVDALWRGIKQSSKRLRPPNPSSP